MSKGFTNYFFRRGIGRLTRAKSSHAWEVAIFSLIFFMGIFFFSIHLVTWIIPYWRGHQEFVVHSCDVLDKKIDSRKTAEGTIYRPEVQIGYEVAGESYSIWTYDIRTLEEDEGYLSDKEEVEQALERYKVGQKYRCWYSPEDPAKAFISRRSSFWGWSFSLIPISLILIGFFGLCWSLRHSSASIEHRAARERRSFLSTLTSSSIGKKSLPNVPSESMINNSPGTLLTYRLPTMQGSAVKFLGASLFCLLWNCAAWSIFIGGLVFFSSSWSDYFFMILFGLLFCGFGLFLLARVIRQLLMTLGIGPTLVEISEHPLLPGKKYHMAVHQSGILRVLRFEVSLLCVELSRFRHGTDMVTHRKEVFRQSLFVRETFEIESDRPLLESFDLRLPEGGMHSFQSRSNEISWKVQVHMELAGWPDVDRECPVIVYPPTYTEAAFDSAILLEGA